MAIQLLQHWAKFQGRRGTAEARQRQAPGRSWCRRLGPWSALSSGYCRTMTSPSGGLDTPSFRGKHVGDSTQIWHFLCRSYLVLSCQLYRYPCITLSHLHRKSLQSIQAIVYLGRPHWMLFFSMSTWHKKTTIKQKCCALKTLVSLGTSQVQILFVNEFKDVDLSRYILCLTKVKYAFKSHFNFTL